MKCRRSTRARVERSMMVVHMVPQSPPPRSQRDSRVNTKHPWWIHSPQPRRPFRLPGSGTYCRGISLSQIRKDDMAHYWGTAQLHTYKLCCDACAFIVFRYLLHIISNEKHTGPLLLFFWQSSYCILIIFLHLCTAVTFPVMPDIVVLIITCPASPWSSTKYYTY